VSQGCPDAAPSGRCAGRMAAHRPPSPPTAAGLRRLPGRTAPSRTGHRIGAPRSHYGQGGRVRGLQSAHLESRSPDRPMPSVRGLGGPQAPERRLPWHGPPWARRADLRHRLGLDFRLCRTAWGWPDAAGAGGLFARSASLSLPFMPWPLVAAAEGRRIGVSHRSTSIR
jgi:hypothetical protein